MNITPINFNAFKGSNVKPVRPTSKKSIENEIRVLEQKRDDFNRDISLQQMSIYKQADEQIAKLNEKALLVGLGIQEKIDALKEQL